MVGGEKGGEGCTVGSLFHYQNHASCFATHCGGDEVVFSSVQFVSGLTTK